MTVLIPFVIHNHAVSLSRLWIQCNYSDSSVHAGPNSIPSKFISSLPHIHLSARYGLHGRALEVSRRHTVHGRLQAESRMSILADKSNGLRHLDIQLHNRAREQAAHTHAASSQCSTTVLLDAGCTAGLIDTSREFMSKACGAQSGTPMPIPALCAPRSRQCAADMTPYISHATVENLELHSDKNRSGNGASQSRTHICGPLLTFARFRTSAVKSSATPSRAISLHPYKQLLRRSDLAIR